MDKEQKFNFQKATTYQAILGAQIAILREKAGLTQLEIAKKIGVNPATWSRIEKGETALSAFQLRSLSKLFDVSMDKLFADFEDLAETLQRQGIDVLSNEKYKNISSGTAATAAVASGGTAAVASGGTAATAALAVATATVASGMLLPIVGSVLMSVVKAFLAKPLPETVAPEKDVISSSSKTSIIT